MANRFSVEAVFKAIDKITAPVSRMQNAVGKFTRSAARGFRSVSKAVGNTVSAFKNLTVSAFKLGAVAAGSIAASVGLLVREFSKIENAQAAFTPLLGSAEKAKQAVDAINETAATTPFQFENLAGAVNQLLPVMNGNIENTIKTVRMLGDTAGGNAQKLDSITRGYTKAMLKGKVDMESLNMIAEAGVPIFSELAESMGIKVNQAFFKMISAGKVTTTQLNKAFEKMTGKGGKFFNGMEIASQTTSGIFSTLKDNISLAAAEIGSILAPTIKDLLKQAIEVAKVVREWVKANRELINIKFLEFIEQIKSGFKALVRLFEWVGKNKETILKTATAILILIVALKALAVIMSIVNIIMMANPIGLIILAITALIAAVAAAIIWWDEIKAAFLGLPGPVKAAISVLTGPIGWLIGSAALVMENWEPIKSFFGDLWGGVVDIFNSAVDKIMGIVDKVKNAAAAIVNTIANIGGGVAEFFGFADEAEEQRRNIVPQVISPSERVARSIEERRTTSTAEVTIRDESGRAEVTQGNLGPMLRLSQSGAF